MNGLNSECHFYQTDGDIVVRCAQINDAERLSQYFVDNRSHLIEWEPRREAEFVTESV